MLPQKKATLILSPKTVFKNDTIKEIQTLSLNHQLNRPIFHLTTTDGKIISKYADNGTPVKITNEKALLIAKENLKIATNAAINSIHELDQWIPRTKFLKHLPIFKVSFKDTNKTLAYISSVTGEIIATNTISERRWAWVGAIPHWIYFKDIRIHNTLWFQLIVWLSGLGFLMVVTGIFTGIVRYKKKPKANFKRFKNKWYNLHYYFGLLFGLFICTWIFSGWMSMTPFSWTPSTQLNKSEKTKWHKGTFTIDQFSNVTWNNYLKQTKDKPIKEVSFSFFNNNCFTQIKNDNTNYLYCISTPNYTPGLKTYEKSINSFSIKNPVVNSTLLTEYDNYYYSRHNTKELPVLKINTNSNTVYYVDLKSTSIKYKCATKNKIQRWIYHGLHSLDFSFLAWNRPLWDIVLIVLLLGGTIVCITAVGLGVKFIKRKIKKKRKRK